MLASPLYLMNTGMALWLAPAMLLLLPLVKPDAVALLRGMPQVMAPLMRFLPLAACAFAGMSVPSAISLSMEGKNAWLMCTAPVSTGTLLGAKALFSFLFSLVPALLGAGLMAWHLRPGWATTLATLLLPVGLCAFLSVWGLVLDLRFARYDWESEQQIVKSSAQMGFGLLSGFVLMALMGAALWLAPARWAAQVAWALALVLMMAAAVLMRGLASRRVYQIE